MLIAVKKQVVKIANKKTKYIYINTLIPNFTYINEKREIVLKNKMCINL